MGTPVNPFGTLIVREDVNITKDTVKEDLYKLENMFGRFVVREDGKDVNQLPENLTCSSMNTLEPITDDTSHPMNPYLCVELMDPTAILPSKGRPSDAGYDVHSFETYNIQPGEAVPVSTKIKIRFPEGYYARVVSRSGLAFKANIEVGAGTIDQNYQGEIVVLLRNFGKSAYLVAKGDRIAQIIITPCLNLPVLKVNSIKEIFGSSARGTEGFGSSGK